MTLPDHSRWTNHEWAERLSSGDPDALLALRSHFAGLAEGALRRVSPHDPLTLVQELVDLACDRVINGLPGYSRAAPFLGWARVILFNARKDLLEKWQQLALVSLDELALDGDAGAGYEPPSAAPSPEEIALEREERLQPDPARQGRNRAVAECFGELTRAEQEAVEAYVSYVERQRTVQYRERLAEQLRELHARRQGQEPASPDGSAKWKYDDALRADLVKSIAARFGVSTRSVYRYTDEGYKRNALQKLRDCLDGKGYSVS